MFLRHVVSIFATFGEGWKSQVEQMEEAGVVVGSKLAKLPLALAIGNVGWPGCWCGK
jgi:hypothetical protein